MTAKVDFETHIPQLLTDTSRLPEIYHLRVHAWEKSLQGEFINKKYFPDGWKDNLDEKSFHWILEFEGTIIAASRICILNDLQEIAENFGKFDLPIERPFAFFSRLVVHPNYRNLGISKIMDSVRLAFIKQNNIHFTLASVESAVGRKDVLVPLGFQELGNFIHFYGQNPKPKSCTAFILHLKDIL